MDIERLEDLKWYVEDEVYTQDVRADILALLDEAIARQSVKSEDVQEAIEVINKKIYAHKEFIRQAKITNMAINLLPHYVKIKSLDLAIPALQEYQPWVSVDDRLPDGDVASVLIYTNKGGVSEGQYYPSIKSWKQFRWSVENADVTHWKPLPEPPKGE